MVLRGLTSWWPALRCLTEFLSSLFHPLGHFWSLIWDWHVQIHPEGSPWVLKSLGMMTLKTSEIKVTWNLSHPSKHLGEEFPGRLSHSESLLWGNIPHSDPTLLPPALSRKLCQLSSPGNTQSEMASLSNLSNFFSGQNKSPRSHISSTMGFPVLHYIWRLLSLMSIEWVLPSNHIILCRPLLFLPSIFPSIRVFASESALHIRWTKC